MFATSSALISLKALRRSLHFLGCLLWFVSQSIRGDPGIDVVEIVCVSCWGMEVIATIVPTEARMWKIGISGFIVSMCARASRVNSSFKLQFTVKYQVSNQHYWNNYILIINCGYNNVSTGPVISQKSTLWNPTSLEPQAPGHSHLWWHSSGL